MAKRMHSEYGGESGYVKLTLTQTSLKYAWSKQKPGHQKTNKRKAKQVRHQKDINHMQCASHLIGNRVSRAPTAELTCAQESNVTPL